MNGIPRIALLYMFLGLAGLLALPIYLLLQHVTEMDARDGRDTFVFRYHGKERKVRKWDKNARTVEKK